jgi:xanthine dehydrogenase YagR molybdenum-binding subunit
MAKRKVIGKPIRRLDGPQKASGRAKYASDLKPQGLLFAAYMGSPYAHARLTSIDTSAAEKTPGVKAVQVIAPAGTEIQWQGMEVAAVAATTEEVADDALRKIKVEYEVLPHLVKEEDLKQAGARAKASGEVVIGDPDQAFQQADAVSEGQYGIPVITHNCLETHGSVVQWQGDQVSVWPSTQYISGTAPQLAPNLGVPAANIKAHMDYIGGGFGSKFNPGKWTEVCAQLSKKAGGAPVKLFLDRKMDQLIAGSRPSAFAKIKLGGKKDGTLTVWQSEVWGTQGFPGGNSPPLPYVIDRIPNHRRNFTGVSVNAAQAVAWRAPNNQQAAYLTCCALDDFAAKLNIDPMEVFDKNIAYGPDARLETYRFQLKKAAELAEWSKRWPGEEGGTTASAGPSSMPMARWWWSSVPRTWALGRAPSSLKWRRRRWAFR